MALRPGRQRSDALRRWRGRSAALDARLAGHHQVADGGALVCAVGIEGARRADEQTPSQNEQDGRSPADVETGSDLPPLSVYGGAVEVPHHRPGRPRRGNQTQQPCDDQNRPRGDSHLALDPASFLIQKASALPSDEGQNQARAPRGNGEDGESPGGLQVRAESEERLVRFAHDLPCALDYAGHPDALPDGLGGDDGAPHEGCDPPHGQYAADDDPRPTQEAQGAGEHLHPHRGHDEGLPGILKTLDLHKVLQGFVLVCGALGDPVLYVAFLWQLFSRWDVAVLFCLHLSDLFQSFL